ncbi:MAG: (4Fe-4S)-binding protein [Clostridia bacterium]|nr:(4Fe-4S)-binding protein [Clostridia bacterium]
MPTIIDNIIPSIREDKCVKCGLCQRVCPANGHKDISRIPEVFACWNSDASVRRRSTSGGMFTLFAETVLDMGGVVFGAVFDLETRTVVHKRAETVDEILTMIGSKYVQSRIGDTYRRVQTELLAERPVLFTGTPCQCAGLKSFLRDVPDHLYLLDLVCHGVPSPSVLKVYLDERFPDSAIKYINFREKNPSWECSSMKVVTEKQEEYISDMHSDPFMRLFAGNYDLNDCCYDCKYTNFSRYGDVTLGDFWGYLSESFSLRDTNKGISLVIVSTDKGRYLLDRIKPMAVCTEKTIEEAITGNIILTKPSLRAKDCSVFWNEFLAQPNLQNLSALKEKPITPTLKHRIRLCLDKNFFLMPDCLKDRYRRIKTKNAVRKKNDTKQ